MDQLKGTTRTVNRNDMLVFKNKNPIIQNMKFEFIYTKFRKINSSLVENDNLRMSCRERNIYLINLLMFHNYILEYLELF